MRRWAIYIDIEGTSALFEPREAEFFTALDHLLTTVWRIGELCFPESPERLFAHQVGGDGIVIVSEQSERPAERAIAIATILMQVVLGEGFVAKAGVSEGDYGHVSLTCLQECPRDDRGRIRMGRGLLTIIPTMGTALVNAHGRASCPPRGARLVVDADMIEPVSEGVVISEVRRGLRVIDWLHTHTNLMDEIVRKAKLRIAGAAELEEALRHYVASAEADDDWKHFTLCLNGVA
jgi:hypothetical protein